MKKLNTKGFTLIELLAVITIMGVLMMVAIPSVTRTIENSRRDTYANITKEYINAVRNAVLADNIECVVGTQTLLASGTPDGTYYLKIDTSDPDLVADLMEKGGKSPFGNADIKGYIKWVKTAVEEDDDTVKTTVNYYAWLKDTGKHGLQAETAEGSIKRSSIKTGLANDTITYPTVGSDIHLCNLAV